MRVSGGVDPTLLEPRLALLVYESVCDYVSTEYSRLYHITT